MIVIDTSVWVEVFRKKDSVLSKELVRLLDEALGVLPVPVLYEVLSGASKRDQGVLRNKLSALPVLYPSLDSWKQVEMWIYRATEKGERFGISDLLIASVAAENGAKIWSLDRDFQRMARLGFVKLHSF